MLYYYKKRSNECGVQCSLRNPGMGPPHVRSPSSSPLPSFILCQILQTQVRDAFLNVTGMICLRFLLFLTCSHALTCKEILFALEGRLKSLPCSHFGLDLPSWKFWVCFHETSSVWGAVPLPHGSSPSWKALSDSKCFPCCSHLARFFFSGSFLMVFSEGSKWHWSVKADSKIYNVFVLADCQQNRPFPVVL